MLMSTLADALSKIVLKFNGVIFNIYHVRCSILLFTFLDEHLEEECVKCFIFFFVVYELSTEMYLLLTTISKW